MCNSGHSGHSGSFCSIKNVFLAFFTGVILMFLLVRGVIDEILEDFIGIPYRISETIQFIIAIIALLAVIFFAICIFRSAWRCCFGRRC